MNKFMLSIIAVLIITLTACQPSAPTCTDRGWDKITNHLYQFDQEITDAGEKPDMAVLTPKLNNIVDAINAVRVDECTTNARHLIVGGLQTRIEGIQYLANGENDSALIAMRDGFRLIISGADELRGLGIALKYPKNE